MITTGLLSALAFLRGLKPWHFIVAAIAAWSTLVATKAYRAGSNAVVTASVEASKKSAVKAEKAHQAAKSPGAADRLRKDACRDC